MTCSRRLVLVLAFALCASLGWAGSASAFTQMRISEIHADADAGDEDSDYVELQMYAPNQNLVKFRSIVVYQASGAEFSTFTFNNDANNGQSQRTILVGAGPTVVGGVTPDFIDPALNLITNDGSVVCFENVDCVAIGFSNWLSPPSPFGTPVTASDDSGGLDPDGDTLQRTKARDCATELDAADDTNDSAADFALGAPTPRRNASPPTETPCGPGGVPARCGGLAATKVGTNGPNVLRGTPKRDVIAGFGSADTIRGLAGNDVLCGGRGRDRLTGGRGRDRLLGGPGRDTLRGGAGKDQLRGGPAPDVEVQ